MWCFSFVQMQRDFNYDGVYLDEIAYDRVTIMRTKAVLGDTKLIDHHCDIGDMGGNSVSADPCALQGLT
jgi:hypothetical protein